jgi:pyridoxine 5-phosphate synthase
MPAQLSVNINKFATLRNSRGGNNPNVTKAAIDCVQFGADGITVHPRPDERHITYADVFDIKKAISVELNIEGNPREQKFVDLVLATLPAQVTLVPDSLHQLTSNHGWDTITHQQYLKETIELFTSKGIRTSIFIDPSKTMIEAAVTTGTNRIELYTEGYAQHFAKNPEAAIATYVSAASMATQCQLGINAGHDLDLQNLTFFAKNIPELLEVSIGHALVCDALYIGLQNTVQMYKRCLAAPEMP